MAIVQRPLTRDYSRSLGTRQAVASVIADAATAWERELLSNIRAPAQDVVKRVLRTATQRPTVSQVTGSSTMRRALERDFAAAQLPPPHRLIVLTRWLPVACVLQLMVFPVSAVSDCLKFASVDGFYKAAKREIGMSVPELRSVTGTERVARELVAVYGGLTCSTSTVCRKLPN